MVEKSNYLTEWKINWGKRHDNDPYCEQCLESTPIENLKHLGGYLICDTCLPEAQKEFETWNQWLLEQRTQEKENSL